VDIYLVGEETILTVEGQDVAVILASDLVRPDGAEIVGDITAETTVIDPSSDAGIMPGNFESITTNGDIALIESFGAIDITFVDDEGVELQLDTDKTAELKIPLADASDPSLSPATVPLYSFNDVNGYWVEEGVATLTEISSDVWAYVGNVSHFSTWNADKVYETTFINGCVESEDGTRIVNAFINATGQDYRGSSSDYTDDNGDFRVAVRINSNVLINANNAGVSNTVQVNSLETEEVTLTDCLVIGDAAVTITLTWGENPRDLDSHLLGPNDEGGEFHVYYASRNQTVNGVEISLDVDDTSGFGPEVITIPDVTLPGTYRYLVRKFSGTGDIAIPARIELNIEGVISAFSPPTEGDVTDYWAVFNLEVDENLNLTVVNVQEWVDGTEPAVTGLNKTTSNKLLNSYRNPSQKLISKKYYSKQ